MTLVYLLFHTKMAATSIALRQIAQLLKMAR